MDNYDIIKEMLRDAVEITVEEYGLEGTEDAIKRVYSLHDIMREEMLNMYYEMYKLRRKGK